MRVVVYIAGAALLVATTVSLLKVLIVPRRAWSIVASPSLAGLVRAFHTIARRLRADLADRFLGFLGPLYVIVLLGSFLGLYAVGFALLLAPQLDYDWSTAFRESGSSVFTLGFESSSGAVASAVDIVAGATGMIVIALFIAYLPTMYAAVKERERFVKLIEGRTGGPPATGVNILAEHFERGTEAMLTHLYREAERWAVGVAETHTKYPVLLHFRAPRSPLHWLPTMVGVADAAALHRVLFAGGAPPETRAVIDAIELCLNDLLHSENELEESSEALLQAESMLNEAQARLESAGVRCVVESDGPTRFMELRSRYRAVGTSLASVVATPLG